MSITFYCPSGHLLEDDESQQGRQSLCPVCGVMFIVPTVSLPTGTPASMTGTSTTPSSRETPPPPPPVDEVESEEPPDALPQIVTDGTHSDGGGHDTPEIEEEQPPELLRIPCPNGHELETPREMLGEDVLCPTCGRQFTPYYEDSVECRELLEAQRRRRYERFERTLLRAAIAAAVIVGIALVGLLVYRLFLSPTATFE